MNEEETTSLVERIHEDLEQGRADAALAATERALRFGEDPVILYLRGVSLLDLDQAEQAVEPLTRACRLDPEEPEFHCRLALALYRAGRFEEALAKSERARSMDDKSPDGHYVLALALERQREFDRADEHFAAAARIVGLEAPRRLSREEFDRELLQARSELPEELRGASRNVAVIVEDIPSTELLTSRRPVLDPDLLGLFEGATLAEQATAQSGDLPPTIYLFQRNLERFAAEEETDLHREIAVTLYHELGHFLGLDEEDLDRRGLT